MEQFDFASRLSLRRQFCHYSHDLPKVIHPIPWLFAWFFVVGTSSNGNCTFPMLTLYTIGVDLFFIYWILQWGIINDGLSLADWGANFALHLTEEIVFVALLRIFVINIVIIELIRPAVLKVLLLHVL
jgi:hypothetical protein